ncbi:MAG: hypothetical protein PVJ67_05470 [Candidatus Pacearchaeota archaeon]|jgi:hypothetical protein
MQEKENILRIFQEVKLAIKKSDLIKLKELSNQTNNTASRTQDPDNIAIAVIIYSLSKILERQEYRDYPGWNNFYNIIVSCIDESIKAIKKNDEKKLKQNIELIRRTIDKLSGNLKKYIQDVFRKASINKALKIHEHGISMEKTARLLGISIFELANYAGEKQVSDVPITKTVDVKDRIKLAMGMFE